MFPIVGRLTGDTYRVADRYYRLPPHGFARAELFELVEATPSSVLLRLETNRETKQMYPFEFTLDIGFCLEKSTLTMSALVRNEGLEKMPACFGFHPAFRWPLPYADSVSSSHAIQFETGETSPVRRLNRNGLIMRQMQFTPIDRDVLVLRDELFTEDALVFDKIKSRRLWYGPQCGPKLQIDFPDMPCLSIWTKPKAGFICIEPSYGYADEQGISSEFYEKPGAFVLEPRAEKCFIMAVSTPY